MVRAEIHRDLYIHYRVSRQRACLHGFDNSLFHGRDILSWNDPAHDAIDELEALSAFLGLHSEPAIAELAVTACLLFVFALHLGAGGDGLLVGDLGCLQVHLHPIPSLEPVHCDLDVELAKAGQDKLAGLFVPEHLEYRVFIHDLVECRHDLFHVRLGLGGYGHVHDGIGEDRARERKRNRLREQCISCLGFFQLRHGKDIARAYQFKGFLGLALEYKDRSHPLLELAFCIVHA